MKIYLDYAATTPIDPRVAKTMHAFNMHDFANPMSVHQFGQKSQESMDKSRKVIATFLNCQPSEVIFTSGATESNNLALKGVVYANQGKAKPHIITSQIEHHCVLETAQWLEKQGLAQVTYLPINKQGIIEIKDLKKAIKKNTVLISIMYVNNEIGTIQPITEIKKILPTTNQKLPTIIHTDAVQAVNYLACDVQELNVDMLSFSGHKIYGPKGIGVLYVKKGTKITRIQHGGEQEQHLRAGTHNVPAIMGLAKAVELIDYQDNKRIKKLRDFLWKGIQQQIPDAELNGDLKSRIPNNLNVSFKHVEGEGILISLDLEGIAVSTGSACSSGSLEASHVILALTNRNHLRSHASIRFSLGKQTTKKELEYLLCVLPSIIARLRKISPFK